MDDTAENEKHRRFNITPVDAKEFPGPYINPWLRYGLYIAMIFLTGTVYMGWSGFQSLLYKSGAFEDLCENAKDLSSVQVGNGSFVDCGARKAAINNLYTIAFSTHLLSSFLTGIVFDHIGPKYLYMIGQFVQAVVWIVISSVPKNHLALRISFFLIGLTAESLIMPLMTISFYFPNCQSLIISTIGATRSLSFMIPVLLSKVFEHDHFRPGQFYIIGISYGLFANMTSCITGACIVQTRFEKAVRRFEALPSSSTLGDSPTSQEEDEGHKHSLSASYRLSRLKAKAKLAVNHPQFVEYIILLVVSSLFLASVEFISKSQRELFLCSDGSSAINLFKYIHILTFAPGPLMGFLVDKLGPSFVLVILHSCCFLSYFFVSFDYYFLKILSCLFYLVSCSMFISHVYCYVSKRFCPRIFGRLVGFCFFCAGLFVIINIPLYNYMTNRSSALDNHNLRIVTRIFMGYMLTGFVMCLTLVYLTTKKIIVRPMELNDSP